MAYGSGTNNPYGFAGWGTFSSAGGYFGNMINTWTIANGYGTSLFTGDLVVNFTNGTIVLATPSNPSLGVITAVQYQDVSNFVNQINYYPANAVVYNNGPVIASVLTDPSVVYDGQSNAAGGVPLTNRGYNANVASNAFDSTHTGNLITGGSTESFDTLASGNAAYNFNVIGLPEKNSNDWGIAYNSLLARINNHVWRAGTAGI